MRKSQRGVIMTSPFIPCPFTYNDAPGGGVIMPMIIAGRNPSDTQDKSQAAGYLWLSSLDIKNSDGTTGSGNLYIQAGTVAGLPNWSLLSAASGALNALSDGSTQVLPTGGEIALVGTANQIVVTSSAPSHELIWSLPGAIITPGSLETTTSLEVGTDLTVHGDFTLDGTFTLTGDLAIGGTLDVTGLTTLAALTQVGTTLINTSGNADVTIGNSAGSGVVTLSTLFYR